MTGWQRAIAKLLLVAAIIVSMLSAGGLLIFTFVPLAVGMWWAVRHSGLVEKVFWVALASLSAAEWAWEITYPVTEGETPSSLIIAAVAGAIMATQLATVSYYVPSGRGSDPPTT
jgi:hypothetical protein